MQYPVDVLTPAERERIAPHVTNLDQPVFALTNLPETVKGALFARYSRYPGTLRRLFLDEFADSLPAPGDSTYDGDEGKRAAELYERIFVGYGDDSVAQLGGAHVAAEWCSNVLTKLLQRPRMGAYLEQSTRYIRYDNEMTPGAYRYYSDAQLGPEYQAAMDFLFATYSDALPRVRAWVDETYPRAEGEPDAARNRAVQAKALDLLRGLLPASSLSHMGIYATGQAYEQLILHLIGHPLPEARHYGQLILDAIKAVMPSFVARVERPDRGGEWVSFLEQRRQTAERWAARLNLDQPEPSDRPSVVLLHTDGDEQQLLAALLFEAGVSSEEKALAAVADMTEADRDRAIDELVGERANRRHRPGRGFESLRYRFEIVSDYGAFRDLQRHRMLTVQWQSLTPDLGAGIPEEVVAAGCGDQYARALDRSQAEYHRLAGAGLLDAAPYALCLGLRIRYILDLNAREALHLVELRSGREGHPTYRAVAHEMHRQICAVHSAVGRAMTHVDTEAEPRLERILSEMRTEARQRATVSTGPAELWGLGDYPRVAERLAPASEAAVRAVGVRRGQRVLDVAAGDGNASVLAARAGATVTATDIAPRMLELGRRRTAGLDVEWSIADAQELPFGADSFDAAVSVFGAVFAPDKPRTAAELVRIVRPGGAVAVTAWIAEGPQADAMAYLGEVTDAPPNDWGDPNTARARFETAGARDVITERRSLDWRFASSDEWLGFMEASGPLVALHEQMGPDRWAGVRSRLLEIMEAGTGAGGGPFAFDNPYLLILARP